MGAVLTVCTKATIIGLTLREVIIQLAPTLCIQVPILDAKVASHTAKNNLLWSGCHADGSSVALFSCTVFSKLTLLVAYQQNQIAIIH
jgi:hypothetical protein